MFFAAVLSILPFC